MTAEQPHIPAPRTPTRDEVIADAGTWLADTFDRLDAMSPREQAQAAHKPGGPSVEQLEATIRRQRGLPEQRRGAA